MKCLSLECRELIRRARRDGGEMRKGRRDRIEKGSRERIEKKIETKRQFEEKAGLRDPALRCSHCFVKSSGYDKLELKHLNLVFTSL